MKNKFGKMNANAVVKSEPLNEHGDSHSHQLNHKQQLYSSSNQIPSAKSRAPDNASPQVDGMIVKIELDDIVNIIENKSMSTAQSQTPNDQNNDRLDSNHGNLYCNKYSTDFFVKKEEEDDQEIVIENVHGLLIQNIGENDDSSSRPAKQARLEDSDQEESDDDSVELSDDFDDSSPRPTKASRGEKARQTKQKLIIINSLKCHKCSKMFQNIKALNAHFNSGHSIKQYRCMYKDCNRSFDKHIHLVDHLSGTHPTQSNVMWPCGHCSRYFKDNNSLRKHYWMDHQEGVFQCAHPDCQFVGELKYIVRDHFFNNHRVLACQHPGCTKSFKYATNLKNHELTHRTGYLPYRCKWPECQYAGSAVKRRALDHIRIHLKRMANSKQKPKTKMSYDPNHYLEVVNELL